MTKEKYRQSQSKEGNNTNKRSPATGYATLAVGAVALVTAGVKTIKKIAKGRAAQKIEDLDESFRNAGSH